MGDSDKEHRTEAPATQPAQSAQPAQPIPETAAEEPKPQKTTLEQARKFLQDDQVQNATPERRVEFLKSKGLSERDIEGLLKEVTQDARPEPQNSTHSREEAIESLIIKKEDRPPIVTYPEFLTKPARPPPLVTVNGFLNTLYAFAGLSTVVYGASRYIVQPMVDSLTEARISFHGTAKEDLAKLVAKLESTVSEIPPPKPKSTKTNPADDSNNDDDNNDAISSYDDPTELFHRDIGVQTSPPPTPRATMATATSPFGIAPSHSRQSSEQSRKETPAAQQARRLSSLVSSLKTLSDGLVAQTESLGDVKTVLDLLKEDLDKLSAAQTTDFVGGYSLYGVSGRNEPDDEIKRAKENIRRVKGVLLSTRSFPATTR
ncbi:Peroxisomal membrane protein PEX14 [Madurella fahalii]|uniref:Peroxisomal membrane protein PEX14 n=1 Tax=Madurella fahalii TaxID=1157608 RepID=A0ABQ0G6F8_9PEZI